MWKDRERLPKKYKDICIHVPFTVGNKDYCADNMGNRFIKNPNKQGKPNLWIINGQDLYSAKMNWRLRKTVTAYFHEYFMAFILNQMGTIIVPEGHYLSVRCDIYEVPRGNMPDISNMWPLIKWFEDALQEAGKLEEDSPDIVRESGTLKYHWVNTPEERKLVFKITLLCD